MNELCGKIGCDQLAVTRGYSGSLICFACAWHASELTDLLGGPMPDRLVQPQPSPFPSVIDVAESKIRQIDRQIARLQEERQRLQSRVRSFQPQETP